jgi:hypothetical protein
MTAAKSTSRTRHITNEEWDALTEWVNLENRLKVIGMVTPGIGTSSIIFWMERDAGDGFQILEWLSTYGKAGVLGIPGGGPWIWAVWPSDSGDAAEPAIYGWAGTVGDAKKAAEEWVNARAGDSRT